MTNPLTMLQVSTREHQMEIIREDGLYRHIRFKQPGTSIWWFDLVTWPGHLVITGDLEDFHFARIDDMFEFFRKPVGYINQSYWAEKLRGPQRYESYSFDQLKRHVYEDFREWCSWNDGPHTPLWQALCSELLEDDYVPHDESSAYTALMKFRYQYPSGERFEFSDSWEWKLRDYDYHFELSLHAIVWGIHWYDTVKAGGPDTPPETGAPPRPAVPSLPFTRPHRRRRRPQRVEVVVTAPRCASVKPRSEYL